jgi:hypothetical protein
VQHCSSRATMRTSRFSRISMPLHCRYSTSLSSGQLVYLGVNRER